MKNPSRAIRRHHHNRMVKRAMRIPYLQFDYTHNYCDYDEWRLRARRICNHMAQCSCSMCGNQRRNTWLPKDEQGTMQERKANDQYKYELEEMEII